MTNILYVKDAISKGKRWYPINGFEAGITDSQVNFGTGLLESYNPTMARLIQDILGVWSHVNQSDDSPVYDLENVMGVPVLNTFSGFGTWGPDSQFNISSSNGDGYYGNNWNFALKPTSESVDSQTHSYWQYCLLGCMLDEASGEYFIAIKSAQDVLPPSSFQGIGSDPEYVEFNSQKSSVSNILQLMQSVNTDSYNLVISNKGKPRVASNGIAAWGAYVIPHYTQAGITNAGSPYWEFTGTDTESSVRDIDFNYSLNSSGETLLTEPSNVGTSYPYLLTAPAGNNGSPVSHEQLNNESEITLIFDHDEGSDIDLGSTLYEPYTNATPLFNTGPTDYPDMILIRDLVPLNEHYAVYASGDSIVPIPQDNGTSIPNSLITSKPIESGNGTGLAFSQSVETLRKLFMEQDRYNGWNCYYENNPEHGPQWYFRSTKESDTPPTGVQDTFTAQLIPVGKPNNPLFLTVRAAISPAQKVHSDIAHYLTVSIYGTAYKNSPLPWPFRTDSTGSTSITSITHPPLVAADFLQLTPTMVLQCYNGTKQDKSTSSQYKTEIENKGYEPQDIGSPLGMNTNVLVLPTLSTLGLSSLPSPPAPLIGGEQFGDTSYGLFLFSKIGLSSTVSALMVPTAYFKPTSTSNLNDGLDNYFDVNPNNPVNLFTDNRTASLENIGNWNIEQIDSSQLSYYGRRTNISYWNTEMVTSMADAFNVASRPNTATFNISVNSWNTSSVVSFERTFKGAAAYAESLWGWNTKSCLTFESCFDGASALTETGSGIRHWKVDENANVTDMLKDCSGFTSSSSYFNNTSPDFKYFNYLLRIASYPAVGEIVNVASGVTGSGSDRKITLEQAVYGSGQVAFDIGDAMTEAHVVGDKPYYADITLLQYQDEANIRRSVIQDSNTANTPYSQPMAIGYNNAHASITLGALHPNYLMDAMLATFESFLTDNLAHLSDPIYLFDHDTTSSAFFKEMQVGITQPGDDIYDSGGYHELYLGPRVANSDSSDSDYRLIAVWSPFTREEDIYTPLSGSDLRHAIRYYFGDISTLPSGVNATSSTVGSFSDTRRRRSIKRWDTSQLESMKQGFDVGNILSDTAKKGHDQFNEDLSSWDFAKVNTVEKLFRGLPSFNNGGIAPHWDTRNVKNISGMFEDCVSLDVNLSSLDMSSVTNASGCFKNASSLVESGIGTWDMGMCTDLRSMFEDATSFNAYLGEGWSSGARSHVTRMFKNASSFNNGIDPYSFISEYAPFSIGDTSLVTDFTSLFENASSFNWPGPLYISTSDGRNFTSMFKGTLSFSQDVETFQAEDSNDADSPFELILTTMTTYLDTSEAVTMTSMFEGSAVTKVNLPTYSVNTMRRMFADTSGPVSLDVNRNIVITFGSAQGAYLLPCWQTQNVEDFSEMFQNAVGFRSDLSMLDTSSANTLKRMFMNADGFVSDISNWKVEGVIDFSEMFAECTTINSNVRLWSPPEEPTVPSFNDMFRNADSMIKNYRGTLGWMSGNTPSVEFFYPDNSVTFTIGDGEPIVKSIGTAKTDILVPVVEGPLESISILTNADSKYFELAVSVPRSSNKLSIGSIATQSNVSGSLFIRSVKPLLLANVVDNYDIDLAYTYESGKILYTHMEVDLIPKTSNCPCPVYPGGLGGGFGGNMNQPTFMLTSWGQLSTSVRIARWTGTNRVVETVDLNAFGSRHGAPLGSGGPPRNKF
jgi:hypothetical protein